MNLFGLAVFIMTYLIVGIITLKVFEHQSAKDNNLIKIRKSVNTTIGPNARGVLKVVLVIAFILIQIKMNFHYAVVFGIFAGVTIGFMAYFFDPKVKRSITNNS